MDESIERFILLHKLSKKIRKAIKIPDDSIFFSDTFRYLEKIGASDYEKLKLIRLYEKRNHPIEFQKRKVLLFLMNLTK